MYNDFTQLYNTVLSATLVWRECNYINLFTSDKPIKGILTNRQFYHQTELTIPLATQGSTCILCLLKRMCLYNHACVQQHSTGMYSVLMLPFSIEATLISMIRGILQEVLLDEC